jgi:predicted PurR-regulated permease PerM
MSMKKWNFLGHLIFVLNIILFLVIVYKYKFDSYYLTIMMLIYLLYEPLMLMLRRQRSRIYFMFNLILAIVLLTYIIFPRQL